MMRTNIDEEEEHTIARFLNGLNYPIQKIVEFQPYTTIVQLVHQATKAERQVKKDVIHERSRAYYASKSAANAPATPSTATPSKLNRHSSQTPQRPLNQQCPQRPQQVARKSLVSSVEQKDTNLLSARTQE